MGWLWDSGLFCSWVADDAAKVGHRLEEYWSHHAHLDFYKMLDMSPKLHRNTVPLFVHADGVKIYKAQKAWVYSISSACRKGASMKTKLVILVVRENKVIKEKTHDAIGLLMGYIMNTLMTGCFPKVDSEGCPFSAGSREAVRAGQPFANGWRLAFAGFKGDWEARYVIHKSKRFYNANWICDHCLASRDPRYTFGDFNLDANCLSHRFSHHEYMILQGDKQSAWRHVKGWTKDRNLEEPRLQHHINFVCFFLVFLSGVGYEKDLDFDHLWFFDFPVPRGSIALFASGCGLRFDCLAGVRPLGK